MVSRASSPSTWLYCDGQDLTYSPVIERKQRLRAILPMDLEGIVAKHKFGPYLQEGAQWFKIRNRKYSQWTGREKFLEREREVDPDLFHWDQCTLVCEEMMTMCEILQLRNTEDQWGEICGRISVDSCDDCGTSVCQRHAEQCGVCPVTLCSSCMGLHAKQHPAKAPQRVQANPDLAVANKRQGTI